MVVDVDFYSINCKNVVFIAFILEDANRVQLFREDLPYKEHFKWVKPRLRIDQNIIELSHNVVLYPMYTTGWGDAVTIPTSIYLSSVSKVPVVCNTKKIESFTFVCTHELIEEAKLMLKTLRRYHDEPIVGVVDDESSFILKKSFNNLILYNYANNTDLLSVTSKLSNIHNNLTKFHRKDCIFKKMEVMKLGLELFNNTFFLDSDIIVCDSLQENFTKDICLSHHYHNDFNMDKQVGIYNAGYIFTDSKEFPEWWEYHYLNTSTFYEQECMNRIPEYFHTEVFNSRHNVGFWRNDFKWNDIGPQINFNVKSFHHHMTDIFDDKQPVFLKNRNTQLRSYINNLINER